MKSKKSFQRKNNIYGVSMKKIFMLIIISMSFFITNSYSQTTNPNKALIFSIDVSKSMLYPSGFFEEFKEDVKKYINNNSEINDLITIYSFGDDVKIVSDVPNYKITATQDLEKLIGYIDQLRPTDDYTYLSKAVDVIANQIESIQSQYPGTFIKAFLFTDGKNEPPTGTASLSLADIIKKHVNTFEQQNGHTYLITIGTELDSESKDIIEKTRGISHGDHKKIGKEVVFEPSNLEFRLNSRSSRITPQFNFIKIREIEEAVLKFELQNSGGIELDPNEELVNFQKNTANFSIPINFQSPLPPGRHNITYDVLPYNNQFSINPSKVNIALIVEEYELTISTELIEIEATTEDKSAQIKITGVNNSPNTVNLMPKLNPVDSILYFEGKTIFIEPGNFEKEMELSLMPSILEEKQYTLTFQPNKQDIKINKTIPITLRITEPFNWGFILIVVIVLVSLLLLSIFFFVLCKWILPKFPQNMELLLEDKNNTNLGSYMLYEHNKFCFSSVTVGENEDIDIDLEGTVLKIIPLKSGIKIKVVKGEVWEDLEIEDNLHSEGDIFILNIDGLILTSTKVLRVNFNQDFEEELSDNIDN